MTQVELATRAGVTQSVISAYESGHRPPAIPTLTALVNAAGYELVLRLRPLPRRLGRLSGPVGRPVRRRRRDLVAVAAAHGARNLRVFRSVARGQDLVPGRDLKPGVRARRARTGGNVSYRERQRLLRLP
jgi:transcriptional regulator with XRE-family HTH domain